MAVLEGYITVPEAAELSGYSAQYVRALCRAGRLPCGKVGRTVVVDREAILAWKAEAERLGNAKVRGIGK